MEVDVVSKGEKGKGRRMAKEKMIAKARVPRSKESKASMTKESPKERTKARMAKASTTEPHATIVRRRATWPQNFGSKASSTSAGLR